VSLPYHIHRTPSQQLPVYKLAKRGGSLKQTRLRKIEGDVKALRGDLMEALGLGEGEVKVNQLTGHVLIKVGTSISDTYCRGIELIDLDRVGGRRTFQSFCLIGNSECIVSNFGER